MLRSVYRYRSSTLTDLTLDQLASAVKDRQSVLWIDLYMPTDEEYNLVLRELFQFHPLAVEDTIKDVHVPKVDDYGTYLYLVFHSVSMGEERMAIDTNEIDVFLGPNYLVTAHWDPDPVIDKVLREDIQVQNSGMRGPAYLLYHLLDRQVDSYIPLLDAFEVHLEELGDRLFTNERGSQRQILNEILTAKSTALRLNRILGPQRDLLNRLARNDYAVIPPEARIYFQDVYDHIVRLADLTNGMRDLTASTIDTHLALINNRTNDVMKVLAIISTIFIPMSFVASVYGMNFEHMPELGWRFGYPMTWLIFISISVGMMFWFRRMRWF